jgi:hypothetical protein
VEQLACRHLMPYEGLGMEQESTHLDKRRANERFQGFLEHAAARGVLVTSFPDFYELDGNRWDPPLAPAAAALPPEARVPFGRVDLPAGEEVRADDSVELAGWALSLGGIERVEVWRETPARGSAADADLNERTLVGTTRTVNGSRPDVSALHGGVTESYRPGWSVSVSRARLGIAEGVPVRLRVVAVERGGVRGELGVREVTFTPGGRATRHLLCRKPFDSVYVDVSGQVHPYPDCQSTHSFGSVAHTEDLGAIWYGAAFRELREQIVRDEPPDMCRGCANLINRNVDDGAYFQERAVELPETFGAIETPDRPVMAPGAAFELTGWALTRSGPTRTFALRRGPDGPVPVGTSSARRKRRKDLSARFGEVPGCERGGWRVRIRREELPGGAPSVIALYAERPSGEAELLGYRRLGFAP